MRRAATIAVLLFASCSALGQDAAAEFVEQLESASFVDRELAADELETNPAITLEDLEHHLMRENLTPEQRLRLERAAMRRFTTSPRAAMGIRLSQDVSDAGLRIEGTVEGYDAAEKLNADDIISVINGHPIRSGRDLRMAIISRSPGEVVPVRVLRNKREMTIDVELGPYAGLSNTSNLQRNDLYEAWLFRSREYAPLGTPELIEPEEGLRAWAEVERDAPPYRPRQMRDARGVPLRSRVVVGGEARPRPGALAGMRLDRPLNRTAQERVADYPTMIRDNLIRLEVEAVAMRERIRRQQVNISELQQVAGRRQQVEHLQGQLESYQMDLNELEKQIERYRAELRDLGIQDP